MCFAALWGTSYPRMLIESLEICGISEHLNAMHTVWETHLLEEMITLCFLKMFLSEWFRLKNSSDSSQWWNQDVPLVIYMML